MTRRSGATSTLAWLTAASCLVGAIVLEYSEGIPLAPTVTAAAIEAPTVDVDNAESLIIDLPSSGIVDDIIDRPLFSASRRPFVPAIEDPPSMIQASSNDLSLQLIGTMVTGETRLALLKDVDGDLLKLRQGQEVDGWLVDQIDQEGVRLQRNEEVEWLKIRTTIPAAASLGSRTPKTTVDRGMSGKENSKATPATNEVNGQAQ